MEVSGSRNLRNLLSSTLSLGSESDTLPSCTTHQNEEVKLYCRAHGNLGCVICMALSHKLCEIDYIPEVSENFLKSDEYLTFEKCIDDLKEKCAVNMSKIEASILNVEETYQNIISAVEQTKKEIIDSLNKFEKELKEVVGEYRKTNIDAMESLNREFETVVRDVVEIESATNKMKKDEKFNSIFCEIKNATTKVQKYQSRTYELSQRCRIQECIFQKSPDIHTVLTKEKMFGSIENSNMELGPCNSPDVVRRKSIGQINIKAEDDKNTCYATGFAFLSADQLAVADKANNKVKIVDVTNNKLISKIALSSSPRDITVIPPNQLAVTLRDEKIIQVLSTASGLTKVEQIKTDGKCRGIEYSDEKLIVTFDNIFSDVQILNLRGQILHRFAVDQTGKRLVNEPTGIAVSPNLKHIYVSDFIKMSILRLSQHGHLEAVFKWSNFLGIVVSSGGSVYACSKYSDAVLKMSDNLSNAKIVLNECDGIKGPIGLAFSKTRSTLYVSCGKGGEKTCDNLHAFKIY